ncbi:SH3 domain-binding glutamic acid-rich-like protein 3 [Striga asiatica]|uniref:SH3 domain-binding glutamic acid-rich-like protein 3 n=1 Tax=Striga asiatica TaxID=4170 RepID=A0A5A7RCP6_STRAF|nr:SH3 domain-binding glutamic acid-rich-like protein 3 [Striga asiatica]
MNKAKTLRFEVLAFVAGTVLDPPPEKSKSSMEGSELVDGVSAGSVDPSVGELKGEGPGALVEKPKDEPPPLTNGHKHCGCVSTTFDSDEQHEGVGLLVFPVT